METGARKDSCFHIQKQKYRTVKCGIFLVLSVRLCLKFCDIRQISVISVIVETVAYNEIIRNSEQ